MIEAELSQVVSEINTKYTILKTKQDNHILQLCVAKNDVADLLMSVALSFVKKLSKTCQQYEANCSITCLAVRLPSSSAIFCQRRDSTSSGGYFRSSCSSFF